MEIHLLLILHIYVHLHIVNCKLAPEKSVTVKNLRQKRKPGGPGGGTCGPADLVSRCKRDVEHNEALRWQQLAGHSATFEVIKFEKDLTRLEASGRCQTGTRLAMINDAVELDKVASDIFSGRYLDIKYWVDINPDLDGVNSFLLKFVSCTCFNDDFGLRSDESTTMEVKRDEYKIKKKRSSDRGMMRGVICQNETPTTTTILKPTGNTGTVNGASPKITSAKMISPQNPTVNVYGTRKYMDVPTDSTLTQQSFDWIIFLLIIIAVTLILGLCVGCVICWKTKSNNRQKNGNQTVVCTIPPSSKEFAVSAMPTAPPAYGSADYQDLYHPPPNIATTSDSARIPEEVYSYECPMENPHVSNFQQPAGLYNGSTGYMDIEECSRV